jgi:hypothetical protein
MLAHAMFRNPRSNTTRATVLGELRSAAVLPFSEAWPILPSVNHLLEFLDYERQA